MNNSSIVLLKGVAQLFEKYPANVLSHLFTSGFYPESAVHNPNLKTNFHKQTARILFKFRSI